MDSVPACDRHRFSLKGLAGNGRETPRGDLAVFAYLPVSKASARLSCGNVKRHTVHAAPDSRHGQLKFSFVRFGVEAVFFLFTSLGP